MGCSRDGRGLRGTRRLHELLVPARRLASAGIRRAGDRLRARCPRHRRPQHLRRRGARLRVGAREAGAPRRSGCLEHPVPARRASGHRGRVRGGDLPDGPGGLRAAVPAPVGRQPALAEGRMPVLVLGDAGGRRGSGPDRDAPRAAAGAAGKLLRPCRGAGRRRPRPGLARRQPSPPRRRAPPARASRRTGAPPRRADGRGLRRALPPSRPAPAAGRDRLHPRGLHPRRGRLPPGGQRRAPPQAAVRDGAAVLRPPRGDRRDGRDRRGLHLLAGRAGLRVPGRAGSAGEDGAGSSDREDLGPGPLALPRRHSRRDREDARRGAEPHPEDGLRALLPDPVRHRGIRPRPGHPVPGARLGRQFRGLLLPRHHRGRPDADPASVRPLHLREPRRAARHRRRFRARAP